MSNLRDALQRAAASGLSRSAGSGQLPARAGRDRLRGCFPDPATPDEGCVPRSPAPDKGCIPDSPAVAQRERSR